MTLGKSLNKFKTLNTYKDYLFVHTPPFEQFEPLELSFL